MYKYSDTGITISSMLDTRAQLKNGGYPVKIRITYKRIRKYYTTGVSMSAELWETLPDAKSRARLKDREIIQITFDNIKTKVKALIKNDQFCFDTLDRSLGRGTNSSVNVLYQIKIDALRSEEKYNTSDWYKYSLRAIEKFAGSNIDFKSITVEFLKKYEKHLLSEGENKSYTTISMYMRAFQSIVNIARADGIIKDHEYPFGEKKYEIPQHAGRKMALSIQDVGKIVNFECENEKQRYCRDLWCFSYLCNGANIVDICNLKFENIKGANIEFYRQKTITKTKVKKKISAVITPLMQSIIAEWGNKASDSKSYIFPIFTGKETALEKFNKVKAITRSVNHYVNQIGNDRLGLGNISTYTARHSFSTVLKRSGADVSFISESLGHSDIKVTENYLDQFEQEAKVKNAKALTDF